MEKKNKFDRSITPVVLVGIMISILIVTVIMIPKSPKVPESPFLNPNRVVGSNRDYIFHNPDCKKVDEIFPEYIVIFKDSSDAVKKGYKACGDCFN